MKLYIQLHDQEAAPVMARSMVGGAVRYVRPVSRGEASGLVAAVYEQIAGEFALVPPMTLHSPVPEILAGVWCVSREAFVVGRAGRARRETVAAAISRINECPYCVEVHTGMLHAAAEHRLAAGLLTGEGARAAAEGNPLVAWGLATHTPGAAILGHSPVLARRGAANSRHGRHLPFHQSHGEHLPRQDADAGGIAPSTLRGLIGGCSAQRSAEKFSTSMQRRAGRFRFCPMRRCRRSFIGHAVIPLSRARSRAWRTSSKRRGKLRFQHR